MGMLDGLLGKISEQVDITNLATKVGLTPEQVQAAVAALGQAHAAPGDTVATAAATTGLSAGTLQDIVGQIGGVKGLWPNSRRCWTGTVMGTRSTTSRECLAGFSAKHSQIRPSERMLLCPCAATMT